MKGLGGLVGAAVLGVLIAGCDATTTVTTDAGAIATTTASASAAPLPEAEAPPRRPTRRYFFARTDARCEVYSIDHEQVTAPESFPCPGDLNPGERLRIAGKTCIRESSDPDRREPVVCPDPLTNLEKRDLARDHPPTVMSPPK